MSYWTEMADVLGSTAYVPVADFYDGLSVFVTGGTGFIGKVLVEKLLRSCPGIKNIYLLMRPKREKDVATRLSEIIACPLFEQLRKCRPLDLDKIIPIPGDVSKPELGISKSDQDLLIENVSVVFHSAATVKLDEALKCAVGINVQGTKRVIDLCHRMLKLKALIHASTAFSNCQLEKIDEVVYKAPIDPYKVIQMVEWLNDDVLEKITPLLIGNRPNTYTFTKALAENLFHQECGNLPAAIVRPSIVISTWREPLVGWVDCYGGPVNLFSAGYKGLYRSMYGKGDNLADLYPVDLLVNVMICAAWRTALVRQVGVTVYNCSSANRNPIIWRDFVNRSFQYVHKYPLVDSLWYPNTIFEPNRIAHTLRGLTVFIFFGYVMDIFMRLGSKKAIMANIQQRLRTASQRAEFFTSKKWHFKEENTLLLLNSLQGNDRFLFDFDVKDIDWSKAFEDYILGIRQFIFKQDPSTLPKARKRFQKLYWMHQCVRAGVVIGLCMAILKLFRFLPSVVVKLLEP